MKNILIIGLTLLLIVLTQFVDLKGRGEVKKPKYVIVIHGGAGAKDKNMPDSVRQAYYNSISDALNIAKKILDEGGSGLDAVEKVINYLEDNPLFNAGKGSVLTSEGVHELDASIMNGKDLSTGAVAGVKHIKNPVSLARLVMEKTPHVLFAGEGAEKFAQQMGISLVDNSYFDTPGALKSLEKWKTSHKGTVGCVILDKSGNLTAGTSTGGMTGKMPGRIGDSPIVNAGTYANNNTCAVSCTGTGELFIRNTVAYNISALMEYKNMSLKEAVNFMIMQRLPVNAGGLIAVDKDGNYAAEFNTGNMIRGVADSNGKFEVIVSE